MIQAHTWVLTQKQKWIRHEWFTLMYSGSESQGTCRVAAFIRQHTNISTSFHHSVKLQFTLHIFISHTITRLTEVQTEAACESSLCDCDKDYVFHTKRHIWCTYFQKYIFPFIYFFHICFKRCLLNEPWTLWWITTESGRKSDKKTKIQECELYWWK